MTGASDVLGQVYCMEVIASAQNQLIKDVRRAVTRGSATPSGLLVAEGFHLLEEALRSGCEIEAVLVSEFALPALESGGSRTIVLKDALFRSIASTETTQGVITLVRAPRFTLDQILNGDTLALVLDQVRDPGNAGAMLRACEAFGGTGAVFLKGSVDPYNPKCLRASAGSIFRLPLVSAPDPAPLLDAIRERGMRQYALTPGEGSILAACDLARPCVLVIGSESRGVSPDLRAEASPLRIPTTGVESLNAAMAASVALYEAARQRMGHQ
jgi:RNA methyltransferase, TrmH family